MSGKAVPAMTLDSTSSTVSAVTVLPQLRSGRGSQSYTAQLTREARFSCVGGECTQGPGAAGLLGLGELLKAGFLH